MRILNDLYAVHGELLVREGAEVTPLLVRKVRAKGRGHKQKRVLLRNTEIFADFKKVFDDKRYAAMLKSLPAKKEICGIAGRLALENDLTLELSKMKQGMPYTYRHLLIVAAFTIKLSLDYKPTKYDKEIIAHCGFTHDIGKTRVPVAILDKEGPLTKEERAIIETHPAMGYLLLNYYLKRDRVICSLASLDHHERLDGSGYPKGIKKIDKYTQLMSVVDVMDALMTPRPYRDKAFSLRATLDYLLREAAAKRFNKNVILALIRLARKDRPDIRAMKISGEIRDELPEELALEKYT